MKIRIKTPRFIVGNSLADSGRIFITHTREPLFIAEVFRLDLSDEMAQMELKKGFPIGSSLTHKDAYIVIGVHHLVETKTHDADQLAKLMSRTGDWYFSHLKKEEDK